MEVFLLQDRSVACAEFTQHRKTQSQEQQSATDMADSLDPNHLVALKDLAISTMWETSALVELLEQRGAVAEGEISC